MNDIETRLRQGPEIVVSLPGIDSLLPIRTILFHRTDHHEDGSQTEYYGIELTEEQHKLLKKKSVEWAKKENDLWSTITPHA